MSAAGASGWAERIRTSNVALSAVARGVDGQMRFRRGDEETRTLSRSSTGAPACSCCPAGLEHMFVEGGAPVGDADEPPPQHYDMERVLDLARKYGWEVTGPPMT